MEKNHKFNIAAALGSLTAAVGLLAGAPEASAQQAPGGGSFPGSFLVPGTNTSIKIGGFVKLVGIYDIDARQGDTIAVNTIPLNGSAAHSLHGAFREHARQSNVSFDTRTPTAYGDLTTFILVDFFGQNTSESQNQATTQNARLVYGYGTLGPFLAGQWLSLWADTDAVPESVDPTGFIGVMDGLSNRTPQFRYTYAAPAGLSAAISIENPEAEGYSNTALPNGSIPAATSVPGVFTGGTSNAFTTSSLGGVDRYPDIVGRLRMDQAWGHVAATAMYRDLKVVAPGVRASRSSWGGELSGHLNTFGKDSLKVTAMFGKGLGHYMSDYRDSTPNGLLINPTTGAVAAPYSYGVNAGYTHWWTVALRSSLDAGYSHNNTESSVISAVAAQNGYDKRHIGGRVNLIWSPVPQVDLGVEYDYARRWTQSSTATTGTTGNMHRVEVESVFKF